MREDSPTNDELTLRGDHCVWMVLNTGRKSSQHEEDLGEIAAMRRVSKMCEIFAACGMTFETLWEQSGNIIFSSKPL